MADGMLRLVRDIRAGGLVRAGGAGQATVVCVTTGSITRDMCQVGDCWLTPKHPVCWRGKWLQPDQVAARVRRSTPHFNFILDRGYSVFVDGLECLTLADDGNGTPEEVAALGRSIWSSKGVLAFMRTRPDFPFVNMDLCGDKFLVMAEIARLNELALQQEEREVGLANPFATQPASATLAAPVCVQ